MQYWIEQATDLTTRLMDKPVRIGLDTEFVRERTYWPKLALVQIAAITREQQSDPAASDEPDILLVDPLAPGMPAALAPLLADPAILKITHSASEDLVALQHTCGVAPQPLFDTQIAAALAGLGAGLGYQKLVQQLTGLELAKGQTRSDWLRRPLSPEQRQYASDDVRYLETLYQTLDARLRTLGREAWLEQDCARLVSVAERDVDERWPHLSLRAAQFLDANAQRRLLRLLRWRQTQARASDRPRNWILDNELAVTLARTPPADEAALRQRLQSDPKAPRKLAPQLWLALTTPLADETQAPLLSAEDRDRKAMVRKLQDAVAILARELDLPEGVLASRRWLEALLDGQWPPALLGWRRDLLEPRLAPLLATGPNADTAV